VPNVISVQWQALDWTIGLLIRFDHWATFIGYRPESDAPGECYGDYKKNKQQADQPTYSGWLWLPAAGVNGVGTG
jgi:hypothetical protein